MTRLLTPRIRYKSMLQSGELKPDTGQHAVVDQLETLYQNLHSSRNHRTDRPPYRLIDKIISFLPGYSQSRSTIKGLYIWGGVGRGKSMLMDMFFDTAPIAAKKRFHFHEFMLDVHSRLKTERARLYHSKTETDPIKRIAKDIAKKAALLCFDEFQVTDIADAMVLSRLFSALFKHGVIIVATSNRPPDDLYRDGLNRQLFLPFIALLKEKLDITALNGPTDYRLDRLEGVKTYLTPVNEKTTNLLSQAFFKLTDWDVSDRGKVTSDTLTVSGRKLFVPKAGKGVAVFSFKRLCASALGSADYLNIAHKYHTVILVAVPKLGPDKRNEAKRFVTLVDALYENSVKLLLNAEVDAENLYVSGTGSFEFERTISRLMEMRSHDYLARGHCSLKHTESKP